MRRREFIAGLGGTAAWPLVARGQERTIPIVGFLHSEPLETRREHLAAFRAGLSQADVLMEYRSAETQNDRLHGLAVELVHLRPTVIVALTTTAARAAKTATETIPIVFLTGADPVQAGLVVSLNHPGGNLTGVGSLISEVAAKRLELLHQLLPATTLVAYLANPTADADFAVAEIGELRRAAQALSLDLLVLNASSENEIDAAFETLVIRRVGGLIVSGDPLFNTQRDQLAALAMRHAVPMLCQNREQVAVGGLMGYGASILDAYHLAGVYTGRILKGEKPANLPVQQPTKFELVINLKTAKALGIEVPPNLLALADEVIE